MFPQSIPAFLSRFFSFFEFARINRFRYIRYRIPDGVVAPTMLMIIIELTRTLLSRNAFWQGDHRHRRRAGLSLR